MFVIQRNDGAFVTRPGAVSSYTTRLEEARVFASQAEAALELCVKNERIVNVEDILHG